MTNKRDLKAYVRYDANGRLIAGSLILQRFKPKVGNWQEIDAYECCNYIPTTSTTTTAIPCPLNICITISDIENSNINGIPFTVSYTQINPNTGYADYEGVIGDYTCTIFSEPGDSSNYWLIVVTGPSSFYGRFVTDTIEDICPPLGDVWIGLDGFTGSTITLVSGTC